MLKKTMTLGLAVAAVAACDDDMMEPDGPIDVTIAFAALVDGSDFACGQSYAGIGTASTEITPIDFRFYVHDVYLTTSGGDMVAVELEDDGVWQRDGLALLDFENGSGPCVNGTAGMNTSLRGTVEAGDYTGLRFVLGVPADMNHIDHTTAAAPQDITGLFWNWNAGYKFARIDHTSADQPNGWNVHLGSTGCSPSGDPTVPATSCANAHRPEIVLTSFDWETDEVGADLALLLDGSDVSQQGGGASGCQAFPADPDCAAVMNRFGLDYEGSTSSGQAWISVR